MNQRDRIQLLRYDQAEKLFKQFESAQDDSAKEEIVRSACLELMVRAQIEEDLHAVQQAIDANGIMDEAEVQHQSVQ